MTERERVAHLLRRFGLGAGQVELERYEKLGWKKALEALLNDDQTDEKFPISHYEFVVDNKGNYQMGSNLVANWWALRMAVTNRPFQEKLTLFWHNHFALDAEKVGECPTMLGYLDVLRQYGRGRFRDLLKAVIHQGGMLLYLDNVSSNRIHPNENLARELFELFTLGVGNYTETDIKETARALTGLSMHYLGTGLPYKYDELRKRASENKLSLLNACYAPGIHDDGVKTVLGKTGRLMPDDVLDLAANEPACALFICKKLWSWFAYEKPEPKVVENLTKVWKKTDGDIKSVLRAIANSPEFWSPQCVRSMPKSPVDFTVALVRALDLNEEVLKERGPVADEFKPLAAPVKQLANSVSFLLRRQGLALLYPPNVSGWKWGTAWITAQNVAYRLEQGAQLFAGGKNRAVAVKLMAPAKSAKSPEDVVDALARALDVPLPAAAKPELVAICTKLGGVEALKKPQTTFELVAGLTKLMFAVPDFQLC